jgi:hypothetical protein
MWLLELPVLAIIILRILKSQEKSKGVKNWKILKIENKVISTMYCN